MFLNLLNNFGILFFTKELKQLFPKELGRVNQVDPLGITNLRIRGMWQIENPRKVFKYLHETTGSEFELVCIIPEEKYISFSKESKLKIEQIQNDNFSVRNIQVKNPNNPAKLIDCRLIKFLKPNS